MHSVWDAVCDRPYQLFHLDLVGPAFIVYSAALHGTDEVRRQARDEVRCQVEDEITAPLPPQPGGA
jgi:hypothetical protein